MRPERLRCDMRMMKEVIAFLFHYMGITQLFYLLNRGRKRILTYHNILPLGSKTDTLLDGVSHSDATFEQQVDYIQRKFHFSTDLGDLNAVTITFDDGYMNQYEVGHAILVRRGVQAYFFVAGGALRSGEPLTIDRLLCWMSCVKAGTYEVRLGNVGAALTLAISSEADRRASWAQLVTLMASGPVPQVELADALEACAAFTTIVGGLDPTYRRLRLMPLTLDALARMREYGHLIGSHGLSHEVLSTLDDDRLEAELRDHAGPGMECLNTDVFSYPFGGESEVTPRVIEAMRRVGRSRAVANVNGPLSEGRHYCELFMPRMSLPDDGRAHILSFVLSGAEHFLKHRRLLPRWERG